MGKIPAGRQIGEMELLRRSAAYEGNGVQQEDMKGMKNKKA